MDEERPIDLRPLDPAEDPWREQRIVGGAMARIRALDGAPVPWLAWSRGALAAAALVVVASAAVLSRAPAAPPSGGMAAAPGVPRPVAEWLERERLPDAAEVYAAVQGYP